MLKTSEYSVMSGHTQVSADRLRFVKAAYTTRRVNLNAIAYCLHSDATPQAGDLLLARVRSLGQHSRLELASGRRAHLHVGDEVLVCYGARYAPDQFEAYVPAHLGECDLVAAGGIAARCVSRHKRMKKPTRLQALGLLADADGCRLNLAEQALPAVPTVLHRPYTIAVIGTAMNAGKTTTAASLVHGLRSNGYTAAAAKVTGTGAGCDRWSLLDAGADPVLDFVDAGVASTFGLEHERLNEIFTLLYNQLASTGVNVVVLEVADGLYQQETAMLIAGRPFHTAVDAVVFAAADALGASAGIERLQRLGLPVQAVSGLLSASPLAMRELKGATDIPVVSVQDLHSGEWLAEHLRSPGHESTRSDSAHPPEPTSLTSSRRKAQALA